MKRSLFLCAAVLFGLAPATSAAVKPHALFGDGMVLQRDIPCPVWGTAAPGEKIAVSLAFGKETLDAPVVEADQNGTWKTTLPAIKTAGGPYTLSIRGKDGVLTMGAYIGEVWIASGQSNMQQSVNDAAEPTRVRTEAKYPRIRLFTVPNRPSDKVEKDVNGKWVECTPETVGKFSAVAYHFGRHLHDKLNVPIGMIHTSWGGTYAEAWATKDSLLALAETKATSEQYFKNAENQQKTYQAALDKYELELAVWKKEAAAAKDAGKTPPPMPKMPGNPQGNPNRPAVLYNGMIAPLQPFAIRGAIWYQGESNAGRAMAYRNLFPAMIQSWRKTWGQGDFPFYFVQLAPFMKIVDQPQESQWAALREAQFLTTQTTPNTAMAVITDVGNPTDIHPKEKEPVGVRMAIAARALTYGEKIEYSGPVYHKMAVEGNKAMLSFKHIGAGLEAKGGPLKGFTIAGKDGKFHNAKAEIRDDTIVVWANDVEKPAAVRYGWYDCPVVNLWNKDGLPATPFRTDVPPTPTPKES